jgi:hypothetical protein
MDNGHDTRFGDGSPNDPTHASASPDAPNSANTLIDLEDEELNVREFRRLIEKFIKAPIEFTKSTHATIKQFLDWINFGEDAEEILNQYNILKRYNNEPDPGIWIQRRDFDFSIETDFDWKHFRYENSGGPSEKEKFLNENKYLLNYWKDARNEIPKLRKYYQPKKKLAVIIQFDEPRPIKKRKRKEDHLTSTNPGPTFVHSYEGNSAILQPPYSGGTLPHSNNNIPPFNYQSYPVNPDQLQAQVQQSSAMLQPTQQVYRPHNVMQGGQAYSNPHANGAYHDTSPTPGYLPFSNDPGSSHATHYASSYADGTMPHLTNQNLVPNNNNRNNFSYSENHTESHAQPGYNCFGNANISNTNEIMATTNSSSDFQNYDAFNQYLVQTNEDSSPQQVNEYFISDTQITYVRKEDLDTQVQGLTEKMEQIHSEVTQNKRSIDGLTYSFGNLTMQTIQNTNDIQRLDYEIAELSVEVNREICDILFSIFRQNKGHAPVGKQLTNKVREILNRTNEELPDRIISNFIHNSLKSRGIVRVYPDQKICVLDEEMARKYRLKD